jgi:hypothetical protein
MAKKQPKFSTKKRHKNPHNTKLQPFWLIICSYFSNYALIPDKKNRSDLPTPASLIPSKNHNISLYFVKYSTFPSIFSRLHLQIEEPLSGSRQFARASRASSPNFPLI